MRLIAILMALTISLSAYEFKEPGSDGMIPLGENKLAYCPDGLMRAVAEKAKAIHEVVQWNQKKIAEATNKAEQYEYMKTAQKVDKQMNDEIEALYNKYINIANRIAEDMCDIRNQYTQGPYKSKLSPEEVYQHLEEYFK